METFAIRRPDRAIWIQMSGYGYSGNLLIAETKPVEITAGLLEADALKQHLHAEGRVAIEVNFAVDKAEILPESQPQIDQVLALLRDDPALRLSVDGHTDASGDAAHNQRLSEARAQAVVAALVARGIDALSACGSAPSGCSQGATAAHPDPRSRATLSAEGGDAPYPIFQTGANA